jgi:hAT family C-terminal dimerisation region
MALEATRSNTPLSIADDLAALSINSEDTDSGSEADLPEHDEKMIRHNDKSYKRGNLRPATKRSRSPNAWYWNHGEEITQDDNGKARWKCEPCWKAKKFTHFARTSNKGIINHLENKHKIGPSGTTSTIRFEITPAQDNGISIQIPSFFNWELLKLRLIEWIVVMHITFSQVESEWFRRFLTVLSPNLAEWIPRAGNTVRAWIITEFQRHQEAVKRELHTSKSRIHLSFDLWTSPNNMAFVGIVGHFMSSKFKVQNTLLGFRRLRGTHTGNNIAEAVLKVIYKYGLSHDTIGWFVLDNASSNDTCVAEILKGLNINDTVEHRRLRCLGHIINLSAKAFLFGSDPNAFDEDIEKTQRYEELKKEREHWRKQGPIGKLHNIVTYILSTPQRREEFEEKVQGEIEKQKEFLARTVQRNEDADVILKHPLTVVRDNLTRWNSVFAMIQRAIILKDPLDLFIKRAREKPASELPLPEEDELTASDWKVLERTRDILEPFYKLTLDLEGRASNARHGSIWEALPAVDFLLHKLEVKSKEYGIELSETSEASEASATSKPVKRSKRAKGAQGPRNDPDIIHLSTGINNCWEKLRKYYALMDLSPVYAAAVVLNPEHKLDYFRSSWGDCPDWIEGAESSVEEFWLTMYKDSQKPRTADSTAKHVPDSDLFHPPSNKDNPSEFTEWKSMHKHKNTGFKPDEYKDYLETEHFKSDPNQQSGESLTAAQKSVNLCAFWARYEGQYPSLARMAYDVLSVPAMSAECERVFSAAKLLLSDRRARMKEDIIEASECLRAWVQADQASEQPE